MGFRDNLQHVRATRNMTQSELAMLVGVSRQSVAKWEAEKSYPEMDKLIKLCALFECTIDDLVRGDLTGRPPDPVRSVPVDAPPVDACGYDEHMRWRARQVPVGVAMLIAGFGMAHVATTMWPYNPGIYPFIAYGICAAVGLALLVRVIARHWAFRRRHPYVEDFYTAEQRGDVRRVRKRVLVGGAALIFVALFLASPAALAVVDAANLWGLVMSLNHVIPLLFWAAIGVGVALIVHGFMAGGIANVARYNRVADYAIKRGEAVASAVDAALRPGPAEGAPALPTTPKAAAPPTFTCPDAADTPPAPEAGAGDAVASHGALPDAEKPGASKT